MVAEIVLGFRHANNLCQMTKWVIVYKVPLSYSALSDRHGTSLFFNLSLAMKPGIKTSIRDLSCSKYLSIYHDAEKAPLRLIEA